MKSLWVILAVLAFLYFLSYRKAKKLRPKGKESISKASQTYRSTILRKTKPRKKVANAYVAGIPNDFQLTPEFSVALDLMEKNQEHLFITGNAGTGKSTLLQYFREKTKKKIVVVAPTGIAAINVGGSTIHSFFRFPPRLVTRKDVRMVRNKKEVFASLNTLVVDEVSMVRADLMDAIDHSLRINRNELNLPFGGVQMILIGDLFQLPPIVDSEIKDYFDDNFKSPFFFDANILKQVRVQKLELQKVFRQTDQEFISLLNKVRNNELTQSDLSRLNERHNPSACFSKNDLAITLTSTNALASEINQTRLDSLTSREYCYDAIVTGEFDEKSFPTDKRLRLKQGAQIMMVKNDPNKQWVNGSLGVIEKISQGSIRVSFGNFSCNVERVTWEKVDYEYNAEEKKIEPVVIGSFLQYPIKLAWAITVHKSQGKTFDRVIIDLGDGAFAHGQAYVALSRCKSFQGIELRTPLRLSDIILDDRVINFVSNQFATIEY